MRVLLIEPNHQLGTLYVRVLESAGHEVDWQKSAQAAISAADAGRPDVVVLELQLAGHGGIEFLYEFRSYTDWQRIPVVIHTFVAEEQFVLQRSVLDSLGISGYLYKPTTSLDDLAQYIKKQIPVA